MPLFGKPIIWNKKEHGYNILTVLCMVGNEYNTENFQIMSHFYTRFVDIL